MKQLSLISNSDLSTGSFQEKAAPSLSKSPPISLNSVFSPPVWKLLQTPIISVHLDQKGYIACGTAGYQCMKALGSFRSGLIESSSETLLVLIEVSLTKKP